METIKNITNLKWEEIENQRTPSTFALKRFETDCYANFYIGINEQNNKCLLHDLNNVKIDFIGFDKNNLKTYKTNNYLVLELLGGDDYYDLFLDLSCSIFNAIKDISIQQKSAEIFKDMILKWSTFFNNRRSEKLGEKEVMGLWGEIFVLKSLLINLTKEVDYILKSWRGPYGSNRDFEFSEKHIEVKTIKSDGEVIEISSEFQLSREKDIDIELRVIKVRQDEKGLTLKLIVEDTINIITQKFGELELFYSALFQKVKLNELIEYDNLCFTLNNDTTYDVNDNEFPKITNDSLFEGISKVKYKINLSKIEKFIK